MNNNFEILFLSILANLCQLDSWQMNNKSLTNEALLKYLQHQDSDFLSIISKQNEKIIEQNAEILEQLKNSRR